MEATTSAVARTDAATNSTTPPTDEQILAQLATLQTLHSKIFQLRSLLPERLIDPVKAAVEASRSGHVPPAALAAHLRSVAVDGDKDVKEFNERWRSEEMRKVWNASKEASFPQGSDVWTVEYRDLVGADDLGAGKDVEEGPDEGVEKVIETFKAENPKVKLERNGDGDGTLLADVTVGGQNFTIAQSESVGEVPGRDWLIIAKSGSQVTDRLEEMLRSLQARPKKKNLKFLLDMIASYADLKTRPCEKCGNIFDDDVQLPAARIENPKQETGAAKFLAYHKGCL